MDIGIGNLGEMLNDLEIERDEWQARAEAAESALDELKSGVYVTEQQMKIAVYDAYVRLFERWNEDSGGYSWAEWLEQRQGESHLATVLENAIDDLFPGVLDIVMAEARTWDKEEVER